MTARTILITGGNGGLGLAMARAFLDDPAAHRVFLGVRSRREAAAALDAELVYAIVPRRSLARMLQKQARRKAGEELAREQWATAADLEAAVEKRAAEWLLVRPRALWDDKAILPTRRLRSRKPVPAPVPAPFRPQPDAT